MATLLYIPDVVTLQLDADKCVGCGLCVQVCPREVLAMGDRKVRIVERDACIECGACALNCEYEAISVRSGVGCATGIINKVMPGLNSGCKCCAEDDDEPCCGS